MSQVKKMRGKGLKLFSLDIRKKDFTEGVIRHWNRLVRELVQSPSLEAFKRHVDVAVVVMV